MLLLLLHRTRGNMVPGCVREKALLFHLGQQYLTQDFFVRVHM
jgi:hypothetical protein